MDTFLGVTFLDKSSFGGSGSSGAAIAFSIAFHSKGGKGLAAYLGNGSAITFSIYFQSNYGNRSIFRFCDFFIGLESTALSTFCIISSDT